MGHDSNGIPSPLKDTISCEDLQKPSGPILTGIGFLDHMIDQFNSHAQIGIILTLANIEEGLDESDRNRHAKVNQGIVLEKAGSMIGREFKRLIESKSGVGDVSHFSCPLDEALVDCVITRMGPGSKRGDDGSGKLRTYALAPFGKFPSSGRKLVGTLETERLQVFFESLAKEAGIDIELTKVRGDNAHHIIESTFKAFSRAMRNLFDGIDTIDSSVEKNYESRIWELSPAIERRGVVARKTKETSIEVDLSLDRGANGTNVDTGIKMLDKFLTELFAAASVSVKVQCKGDLWIDEHHTAEDVAIAIGQTLDKAFGSKAGLNRMWSSSAISGKATVKVVMDLSNRPCLTHNLMLDCGDEKVDDLTLEMFEHVLDSLVVNSRMTVHVVQIQETQDLKSTIMATAKAFGAALKCCASLDKRRAGATASSKGTLSV